METGDSGVGQKHYKNKEMICNLSPDIKMCFEETVLYEKLKKKASIVIYKVKTEKIKTKLEIIIMKISREKLVSMIKESISKFILNENLVYANAEYIPSERNLLSFDDVSRLPEEVKNIFNKRYTVTFKGNSWYQPEVNRFSYGDSYPEESGVEDIEVSDDGGFYSDLDTIVDINPDLYNSLYEDFDGWCSEHDDGNLNFQIDKYDEYDNDDYDYPGLN